MKQIFSDILQIFHIFSIATDGRTDSYSEIKRCSDVSKNINAQAALFGPIFNRK